MLHMEWNLEDAVAVASRESHEKGHREGRKEGHHEVLNLIDQGLTPEEIKQRLIQAEKE